MLNTWTEANNTGSYSYLACFVNTFTLNMYVSMSYTGLTSSGIHLRYSDSCGCARDIREYRFNT